MQPGSASRATRNRCSASSYRPCRTRSFAASTSWRDCSDREGAFSSGGVVSDPGTGAEFGTTPTVEDAAGGLPCDAQPEERRRIEIATNGVKLEGRVSMSSCLLGERALAKLSGVT